MIGPATRLDPSFFVITTRERQCDPMKFKSPHIEFTRDTSIMDVSHWFKLS